MPEPCVIGFKSAVVILERAGRKKFEGYERIPSSFWGTASPRRVIREAIREQYQLPELHVVIPDPNDRKGTDKTVYHVWAQPLPEGSLIQGEDGLVISSPEFCLLQMATVLTDVQLARLVMQFCGRYSPEASNKDGFVKRDPLTSVNGIRHYLQGARRQQGAGRLARVLAWVADNAWSPREASLELLMTMPVQRGGFHFPKPLMNVTPDDITDEVKAILGKDKCIVDLLWNQCLAMEYLGRYRHDEKFGVDIARTIALGKMGIHVELIAAEQLKSAVQMDIIARRVAGKVGRRTSPGRWPEQNMVQKLIDELVKPLPTDPKTVRRRKKKARRSRRRLVKLQSSN